MAPQEFWNLLEGLDPEDAADELAARLRQLPPSTVAQFNVHFDRAHQQAYRWLLWGAAYLVDGGCSDDGFIDFRNGLILRGHAFYERVLQDPDSLADLLADDDYLPNEDVGYVAGRVYEEKAGERIPEPAPAPYGDPAGEAWGFDDPDLCAQRLPRLWARYGGS